MIIKRNARNITLVGWVVLKFSWDVRRTWKEFVIGWYLFLKGLSVPHLWLPFFVIRPRIRLLKDVSLKEKCKLMKELKIKVKELGEAGVEHRELRYPEKHIGFWRGKIVFIDFDRSRFSKRSRDLNKFREWMKLIESLCRARKEGDRTVQLRGVLPRAKLSSHKVPYE